MNLAGYRVRPRRFYEGNRVVCEVGDGPDLFGEVVDFDGPNPLVLVDGAAEPEPYAAEDLLLTAGNYPASWSE
jgi:hypothetical protein